VGLLARSLTLLPGLLETASTAVVLLIGGVRIMQGALTVGELVAFQVLLAIFLAPVGQLVGMAGVIQTARADVERLDDVLRHPLDPAFAPSPSATSASGGEGRCTGRLELRGVSFGYSRLEPPLIQSLDLAVEPGRCVALVGGSGSGKSTVARLVVGLYEPWSGEILFDGRPRTAYDRQVLGAAIGSVDQDLVIFEGTVRENLTLWDDAVDDAALDRALEDACLRDEIHSRPGGLDAGIGVGGSSLSGGQRQRLEIARSLVRDPGLLVLDEATSALDPITETTIMGNLRRRGCALLLVAHRLSTIRDADEIVVLERGCVVERGTHHELLARGGAYARLIEAA
jgi:ABC-type bacteriocin/lantibiotic exporter with double-glycine peptidase domain